MCIAFPGHGKKYLGRTFVIERSSVSIRLRVNVFERADKTYVTMLVHVWSFKRPTVYELYKSVMLGGSRKLSRAIAFETRYTVMEF